MKCSYQPIPLGEKGSVTLIVRPIYADGKREEKTGMSLESLQFSDFTKSGYLDVDDVLRPIYKDASKKLGREFPYPGDK